MPEWRETRTGWRRRPQCWAGWRRREQRPAGLCCVLRWQLLQKKTAYLLNCRFYMSLDFFGQINKTSTIFRKTKAKNLLQSTNVAFVINTHLLKQSSSAAFVAKPHSPSCKELVCSTCCKTPLTYLCRAFVVKPHSPTCAELIFCICCKTSLTFMCRAHLLHL